MDLIFILNASARDASKLAYEKLPLLKSLLVIATGSLLVSGCVTRERAVYRQPPPPPQYQPPPVASQEIIVTEAPPQMIVEMPATRPTRPGPDYIWIEGAYVWHGH